jgi:GT2 family glycosyltransferase
MKKLRLITPKKEIDLSIVIVNFNTGKFISRCLDFIRKNPPKCSYEIFVVDNNSKDNSVEIIKNHYPEVKLIQNSMNLGFSYANNQAIVRSKGRYILVLNPDTIVTRGAFDSMVRFMDAHPETGVGGAKILNFNGSIQYSCRRFPTLIFVFFGRQSVIIRFLPTNRISKKYLMMDEDYSKSMEVDWVFGACMILRRKALEDVGVFDEDYFIFVEDTDLCYRMRKKGWKVHFISDAVIFHHLGVTRDHFWKTTLLNHNLGMFKFFKKHYNPKFFTQFLLSVGLLFRLLFLVVSKITQGFFQG